MTKHFISVGIVGHKLMTMPHVLTVTGEDGTGAVTRGLGPVRGLTTAAIVSSVIWAALIVVIAR